MSVPAEQQHRCTIEEYLRLERDSSQRHEYYDGEVVAMAGGSPQHSLIICNITRELGNRLKGTPCRVYEANLRVRIPRSRLYVYPDATIVCGPPQFDADDRNKQTIINPTALVEVLSPATANIDYGIKFRRYLDFDSLQEYVIVAQDGPHVQSYFRRGDGTWIFTPADELNATIPIRSMSIALPLTEIYAGVEFPPSLPSEAAPAESSG